MNLVPMLLSANALHFVTSLKTDQLELRRASFKHYEQVTAGLASAVQQVTYSQSFCQGVPSQGR